MGLRAVELQETERGFRVSRDCKSQAEAIACAHALFNVPPAAAYGVPKSGTNVPETETPLPENVAAQLAVIGAVDSDDNAGELKHGEAG